MDYAEFYNGIEEIFLFPGSLQELSESRRGLPGVLVPVPLDEYTPPLSGIRIPSPDELEKVVSEWGHLTLDVIARMEEEDEEELAEALSSLDDSDLFSPMVPAIKRAYSSQYLQDMDIRVAAQKLGAQGVICASLNYVDSLEFKEGSMSCGINKLIMQHYTGVPVRLNDSGLR